MSNKIHDFHIDKLKGSDNFHTWKFAITNYLEMNDLEKTIDGSETDEKKKRQRICCRYR